MIKLYGPWLLVFWVFIFSFLIIQPKFSKKPRAYIIHHDDKYQTHKPVKLSIVKVGKCEYVLWHNVDMEHYEACEHCSRKQP